MHPINIQDRIISLKHKPFLIAEMSGNHNQSLERALQIVDAAADAGADAIKLQTYTADTLTIDFRENEFFIADKNSLWKGKSLYELYQEAYTPWEWHKAIFEHAQKRGIIAFSTPFDETSVDFLEELNVPAYKIASFENNHLPLLKKVAQTGKPVIMSTGTSTLTMIEEAVQTLRENGCKDIILLKCTSTYPATPENSNILTIPHLAQLFNCHAGLSDHTMGIGVAVASIALGARVIEKHFCLSRAEGGVDSAFSLEPHEFKMLVEECNRAFLGLGQVHYGILEAEKKSLTYKRSIYVVQDIKAGEPLTPENIRIIRPGLGLQPKYYEIVLGKIAKQDLKRGTALHLDMLM
ncbi:pseudaminic acid synthase [Raineya orbicola]|jgi:N-acetylneuraminate synthase|uniref:PseI: pseudaminic acid synthase n=1 Tax=Raineya orbicola TaxID=2016530 RepID=A0A2N3IKJ3_9BACT|nr:pseudaminic acid synthase [Raineya orbicola]PKQ70845.1 PseI: pseudaminic acid synthase [Raineya orbicola]